MRNDIIPKVEKRTKIQKHEEKGTAVCVYVCSGFVFVGNEGNKDSSCEEVFGFIF